MQTNIIELISNSCGCSQTKLNFRLFLHFLPNNRSAKKEHGTASYFLFWLQCNF